MSIRSLLAAAALSASVAFVPFSSAQAGEDEETFALGAAAGVAAVVVLGALGFGAARANDVRPLGFGPDTRSNEHIAYCQNRYRTYRVSDGTFQPNNGPCRLCVSPFSN